MVSSESLQKGGKSGPAIVPGKPDESLLIQAISHTHPRLKMPPQGQLPSAEIADLRTWVEMGAPWPASGKKTGPVGTGYVITAGAEKVLVVSAGSQASDSTRKGQGVGEDAHR